MTSRPLPWRAPDAREQAILEKLIRAAPTGSAELLLQLRSARVRQILEYDDSPYSLEFSVPADLPRADVPVRIPSEGHYRDADGETVSVLLHVVDGRLDELEAYRPAGGNITLPPRPDTLVLGFG